MRGGCSGVGNGSGLPHPGRLSLGESIDDRIEGEEDGGVLGFQIPRRLQDGKVRPFAGWRPPPGAGVRSLNQRCTPRVAEQHYRSIEMTVHDHCALPCCSFGALIEPKNNEFATRPSDIVNPDPGL
jgi:hypothetical protein